VRLSRALFLQGAVLVEVVATDGDGDDETAVDASRRIGRTL
jgi:hypothetical protein